MSEHQWFKNEDHPDDYKCALTGYAGMHSVEYSPEYQQANDWEGQVARRFRHPYVGGKSICPECHQEYDQHGWIDQGNDGLKVCPGDIVIDYMIGDEQAYEVRQP